MLMLALFAFLLLAAPAHAIIRLPAVSAQVAHNPAERLIDQPIEDSVYDPATHCTRKQQPGMAALQRWLEANVRGVSWGTYRCEKWGKRQASLHSEGRAIDWHLDAHDAPTAAPPSGSPACCSRPTRSATRRRWRAGWASRR